VLPCGGAFVAFVGWRLPVVVEHTVAHACRPSGVVPQCSRPYAQTLAAVSAPSAEGMAQRLGSVGPHEPLLTTVGTKRIIAFFVPDNGQCNVQAVLWNADDIEAKSAAGVRFALNPSQTASIDSSPTETFTLKCGDHAESLASVDTDQQVASK
jgi:hypothetical protein